MKKAALWLVMLALGACVAPGETPTKAGATAESPQPVSPGRAVALFDAICGASLEADFATAKSAAAKVGVNVPSPLGTTTLYGKTEDVSLQIKDGPGFGKTCSFVFVSTAPTEDVLTELTKIGPFMNTPFGPGTLYRGQRALVLLNAEKKSGNKTYYNLRLLSDR